jgi:cytochrome c oxidase subunit IV
MAQTEHKEHIVPPGVYLTIVVLLMALLVVTVIAAFIDVDQFTRNHHLGTGWNTGIAMTIAIVKGLLIVLFFMHVKYSTKLTWVFASAGFIWLVIMFVLTFTDYATRTYPLTQRGEPAHVTPE